MSAQQTPTFHWQFNDFDDGDFQIRGRTLLYVVVLFSIIVVITFLFFLYTRWIGRRRSSPVTAGGHASSLLSRSSTHQGLDSAVIDSFPISVHRRSPETNETSECSICLGVFEEGEKVKVLPVCSHSYHCECVDKWLVTHSSCPVCRASLRVDSPV